MRGAQDPLIVEIIRQIVPTLRCFWGHAEVMQQSLESNHLLCNQVGCGSARHGLFFFSLSFFTFCLQLERRSLGVCLGAASRYLFVAAAQTPAATADHYYCARKKTTLQVQTAGERHPQERIEKKKRKRHEKRQTTNKRQDQDNQTRPVITLLALRIHHVDNFTTNRCGPRIRPRHPYCVCRQRRPTPCSATNGGITHEPAYIA